MEQAANKCTFEDELPKESKDENNNVLTTAQIQAFQEAFAIFDKVRNFCPFRSNFGHFADSWLISGWRRNNWCRRATKNSRGVWHLCRWKWSGRNSDYDWPWSKRWGRLWRVFKLDDKHGYIHSSCWRRPVFGFQINVPLHKLLRGFWSHSSSGT